MSAPDFLDTNILVYAYDPRDRRKYGVAQDLVRGALAGKAVLSIQVLAEYAATLLHKLSPRAETSEVRDRLDSLGPARVIAPDSEMVQRAIEAREEYGLHFYDGLIVAAAERGGCARIWSEDFSHGQEYFGVRIENPFR